MKKSGEECEMDWQPNCFYLYGVLTNSDSGSTCTFSE
jgi:hypothetical protein